MEISDQNIRTFANSFEDQRIMMIVQLRFIAGLSWGACADCLGFETANQEYIGTVSAVDVTPDIDASRILPILSLEDNLPRVQRRLGKISAIRIPVSFA